MTGLLAQGWSIAPQNSKKKDANLAGACHRLNKECQSPVPVRRLKVKKPFESRTTQLEEKLEDLVSLLRAQATTKSAESAPHPNRDATQLSHEGNADISPPSSTPTVFLRSTTTPSPVSGSYHGNEIPLLIAEEYLTLFRTCMLHFFPFVHIPSSSTAEDLRRVRPFLWLCIMCTSTKSTSQQIAIAEQIRQVVCQRVVNENERSIDLLLGIICYVGWSHYYRKHKSYLSMWTTLTTALIFDLGLNKPPPGESTLPPIKSVFSQAKPKPIVSHDRTMEERRATLSVFLITSTVSTMQKKIDSLRWTPHMEASLRILSKQPECQGDMVLAAQVRCRLMIEQISNCPWRFGGVDDAEVSRFYPASYFKVLQSQLQEIKRSLPSDLAENAPVQLFLHSTELALHDGALNQTPTVSGATDFQILEGLFACLKSIDSWFRIFFAMPPFVNVGITQAIFSQLSHCLVSLFRLTTLEDISWDRDAVRKTANVFEILDRIAACMEQVRVIAGLANDGSNEDIFSTSAKVLGALKRNWEAEAGTGQMSTLSEPTEYVKEWVPYDLTMDLVNDQWLEDIYTSWEF